MCVNWIGGILYPILTACSVEMFYVNFLHYIHKLMQPELYFILSSALSQQL